MKNKYYLVKNGKMIEFVEENFLTGKFSITYCNSIKKAQKFDNLNAAYFVANLVNAKVKEIK